MKIAVDAALASPRNRGTGAYVMNVIDGLCQLAQDEIIAVVPPWFAENIDHLTPHPNLVIKLAENLGQPPSGEFELRQHWEQGALPDALKETDLDVLLGPAFALPLDWPGPATATVHDLAFERRAEWNSVTNDDYHIRWAKPSAEHAQSLLAVSQFTASEIEARWHLPDKEIFVSPLAPSLQPFEDSVERAQHIVRTELDIHGRYILYIGDSIERKNLRRLLTAFQLLVTENNVGNIRMVFVTPPSTTLKKLAVELGVSHLTTFIDYCPEEVKPYLYSAAEISVYPALFEGFGLPPLESMRCGTAVATSAIDVISEVVGDSAARFDPLDVRDIARAMHELVADESYRRELETAGRARAAQFTWRRTAQVTRDALCNAVARFT